jgi:N-methylhydantoinase A
MPSSIRVAVDIGGTFTDIEILENATGRVHQFKTPSTPADPSIGLIGGIKQAAERFGFDIGQIEHVLHGTTIATNAVLQRRLPPAGLITTQGFEDVLQIGRHGRRDVYALTADPAPALVPRRLCLGVSERVAHDGRVLTALDAASVRAAAGTLKAAGVEAVAVCLLHAYANPAHERGIGAILEAELPGVAISLSSELSPEIREYERMSTTVLNAMLMPIVERYTTRLAEKLGREAPSAQVYLVQSNGGVSGLAKAGREPARLLLSGPSGGAAAARRLAQALDQPNLVAIDMGGTSFDISIVSGGAVAMVNEGEVDGLPVRLPMVEMRTIGAGGGSIAWVDDGGRLRIGPQSAGAQPGPSCYGQGGADLTVTDANLLLGRLDGASFMGGAMPLDRGPARTAAARVADELGLTVDEAAAGVIAVTNSTLATAIRLSLFEKGLDPEDFSLLSFGGAGGVHACEVADELGIARVIFPPHASTLSAWGILWSDIVHDLAATEIGLLDASGPALAACAERLALEAASLLAEDGVPDAARKLIWSLDLRYAGQAFDLNVALPAADFSAAGLADARAAFDALHRQRFSYDEPSVAVELVTLRLSAIGALAKPAPEGDAAAAKAGAPSERSVWTGSSFTETAIWQREAIGTASITGPALVEEVYTSSYIPPGWSAEMLSSGALVAVRSTIGGPT